MESILTSIKKMLGIAEDYEHFDLDIIIHINSALVTLTQIGVGPSEGFSIRDKSAIWKDFIENTKLEFIKTYVYLKVKSIFDPPPSAAAIESMKRTINELEWRISVEVNPGNNEGGIQNGV